MRGGRTRLEGAPWRREAFSKGVRGSVRNVRTDGGKANLLTPWAARVAAGGSVGGSYTRAREAVHTEGAPACTLGACLAGAGEDANHEPPADSSRERPAVTANRSVGRASHERPSGRVCRVHAMSQALEYVASSGIGGAVVAVLHALAKRLRARSIAARVRREAQEPGGPEYGTPGWIWKELGIRIGEVRSKGHANEAWCAQLAQRVAALETAQFGNARLASGEQERLDYQREREGTNDTEPEPLPAFTDRRSRRSRP